MVTLDDLTALLKDFMGDVGDKDPYMPNGLQVRGREEVKLLATGVSASLCLFEEAMARKADALLVHHGMNLPPGQLPWTVLQSPSGPAGSVHHPPGWSPSVQNPPEHRALLTQPLSSTLHWPRPVTTALRADSHPACCVFGTLSGRSGSPTASPAQQQPSAPSSGHASVHWHSQASACPM